MNIIYKHTCNVNNLSYIGKTKDTIENRLYNHLKSKKNSHFSNALKKYGVENFTSVILEKNISDNNVNKREKYWIKYYDTFPHQFNKTEGGDGGNCRHNYKHNTKEHNKKISVWHKDKVTVIIKATGEKVKVSREEFINNRNLYLGITEGIKKTKEHKQKISESLKGKNLSKNTKKKISESLKGAKNPNASIIIVYNNEDKKMFTCNGGFRDFCNNNDLPFHVLSKSYRNNGSRLYQTPMAKSKAKDNIIFQGWYALKIGG